MRVVTVERDEYTHRMLNEYVLQIGELIQLKLNPSVQKQLRDIEHSLVAAQQFVLTAALAKRLVCDVLDELELYQRHEQYGLLHVCLK